MKSLEKLVSTTGNITRKAGRFLVKEAKEFTTKAYLVDTLTAMSIFQPLASFLELNNPEPLEASEFLKSRLISGMLGLLITRRFFKLRDRLHQRAEFNHKTPYREILKFDGKIGIAMAPIIYGLQLVFSGADSKKILYNAPLGILYGALGTFVLPYAVKQTRNLFNTTPDYMLPPQEHLTDADK